MPNFTGTSPMPYFMQCQWYYNSVQISLKNQCATLLKTKKGHVISFTSLHSVILFFSLITSLNEIEVKASFVRKLKSLRRNKHKVKLIVEDCKNFAFVFKQNIGKMSIPLHYGEWNTHDYPQHPCQLT